jgi:hypothetical protein
MIRRRDDRGRRRDQIDEASQRTRRRDDMLKTAIATKRPPHVRARHRRVQVDNPGTPCGFAAPKMFRATSLGHRCGGRRPAAGRRYERLRVAALYSGSPDDVVAAAVGGFPLKRFAAAAEIAAAVAFMASPLVN